MNYVDAAVTRAKERRKKHLDEFREVLAIPSISTLSEHAGDVRRMADRLVDELKRLGMTRVDLIPAARHPIIYAEWLGAPGKPTVLIYGHYDVQPVDPLSEWTSGPFDADIRGDYVFARGASDMKGQIFAQLKAMECLFAGGSYPCNVKYLIEGEEEIGSPSLDGFIDSHLDLLKADFVLNCDAGIHAPDVPAIIYSLRGLAYFEIELRGSAKDMHSGLFGGSVRNPAQVLCELIAGMHDADGRVTLPGFYEKVRALSAEERKALAELPYDDAEWIAMATSKGLWGEKGYTTIERVGARPTLEVNGIWGGFTGEGSKTVLPAKASAKISTRLVADQEPGDVHGQLRAYMGAYAPKEVDWTIRELTHGPGAIMDRHSPAMMAAVKAFEQVFGKAPIFKREGGSVPVVALLQRKLGLDSVMLGFALPDDGIHGPNERQYLPNFYRGIETYIHFLANIGS